MPKCKQCQDTGFVMGQDGQLKVCCPLDAFWSGNCHRCGVNRLDCSRLQEETGKTCLELQAEYRRAGGGSQ